MDSLAGYGSDGGSSDSSAGPSLPVTKRLRVDAAPDVATEDIVQVRHLASASQKEIRHNVPFADLSRPMLGPENPFKDANEAKGNTVNGSYEATSVSDAVFLAQQRTYNNFGYAVDPTAVLGDSVEERFVGDVFKAHALGGRDVTQSVPRTLLKQHQDADVAARVEERRREFARIADKMGVGSSSVPQPVPQRDLPVPSQQRKRKVRGDPADVAGFMGPWAPLEGEDRDPTGPTPEEVELATALSTMDGRPARGDLVALHKAGDISADIGAERTTFHGAEERDFMGRTYMAVPKDQGVDLLGEPGSQECFMPKRLIHTWTGHTKGVNCIRFFPNSGHLLLSCSMDGKVKIWDCYNDRRCLRTYAGHTKGVRDIFFTNDGAKFATASYDRYVKLWDTETGQCVQRLAGNRIPYCVVFHPKEQNMLVAGCSDKKIVQYDLRAPDPSTKEPTVVQEYDQHLAAVNTVTFVDEGRRLVSTSDDKTMRVWEWGINVVIKYVADPSMHSMPAVALSPNKKWLACQSLDNQLLVYGARDRFSINRKKRFAGHVVAGYACRPSFSPDGRFVTSGDGEGKVWFWDWKTTRILKKMRAHEQVVMCAEWHPHETSKLATCSWDGTIKYWD